MSWVFHTTKAFADQHRIFPKTRLLLSVGGSTFELIVARPDNDDDDENDSVSTHADYRRPKLTIAESA